MDRCRAQYDGDARNGKRGNRNWHGNHYHLITDRPSDHQRTCSIQRCQANDKSLVIPNGDEGTTFDVDRFLRESMDLPREDFDAVMFWDLADFLPEALVKPVIERIHYAMKPKAIMLAFFHTKDAGPDAPFYRYNIVAKDTLELQPVRGFRLQRIYQNRQVENLFRDYASVKFFLGRDNIREVLMVR